MDTDSDPSEELPLAARAAVTKTAVPAPPVVPTTVTTTATTITTATPAVAEEPVEQEEQPPAVPEPPPASQTTPEDPPAVATPTTTKVDKKRSHKKKGRNQYTREDTEVSPARSQSGEAPAEVPPPPPPPPPPKPSKAEEKATGHGKHGKNKGGMNSKITMTDMKRRAAALLDFISRTQVELAGESPSEDEKTTNGNSVAPPEKPAALAAPRLNGVNGLTATSATGMTSAEGQLEKDFKELSCVEMMDSLTRRLVKWQQEYTV